MEKLELTDGTSYALKYPDGSEYLYVLVNKMRGEFMSSGGSSLFLTGEDVREKGIEIHKCEPFDISEKASEKMNPVLK